MKYLILDEWTLYLEEGIIGIFPICVKGIVPHLRRCPGVTSLSSENLEQVRQKFFFPIFSWLPQLDVSHMKMRSKGPD